MTGVRETKYISKEDAFKIYAELNKGDPELVKLVSLSILPASVEVYLSDPFINLRTRCPAKPSKSRAR